MTFYWLIIVSVSALVVFSPCLVLHRIRFPDARQLRRGAPGKRVAETAIWVSRTAVLAALFLFSASGEYVNFIDVVNYIGAGATVTAVCRCQFSRDRGQVDTVWTKAVSYWLAAMLLTFLVLTTLIPVYRVERESAVRSHRRNNMKQMGLALWNYSDRHGHLPRAAENRLGQKISWRVTLLPELEHRKLRDDFQDDQAWDSPANAAVLSRLPDCYFSFDSADKEFQTRTVAVVGRGTMWDTDGRAAPLTLDDITDGLDSTITFVSSPAFTVPWCEPRDLQISLDDPTTDLGTGETWLPPEDGPPVLVGFADGSIAHIHPYLSSSEWAALFSRAGGEEIDRDEVIQNAYDQWLSTRPVTEQVRGRLGKWLRRLTIVLPLYLLIEAQLGRYIARQKAAIRDPRSA